METKEEFIENLILELKARLEFAKKQAIEDKDNELFYMGQTFLIEDILIDLE